MMKTTYFHAFLMLFAFTLLFVGGCKKPCKGVECANGTCNEADGSCTCNSGWFKDASGKCTVQDACYNKNCGHGNCVASDGSCLCDAGWTKDATGKCTVADLCYNVDCGTHGACNQANGACECITGYEVNVAGKCDSLSNAKFIGAWTSFEVCNPAVDTNPYTISITPVTGDLMKVRITNFGRTQCVTDPLVVTATINGANLTNYTTTCSGVTGLSGSCNLSGDGLTLNVTYVLTVGGTAYNCFAAMAKQ